MKRFIAIAFVAVLAGCGQSGGDSAEVQRLENEIADLEAATSTTVKEVVAETTTTATEPPTTVAPTTTASPTTTSPPTTAPPTTAAPANVMPDVVCMNLQDAQDYIQEVTDVFYSQSVDATGQGRSQIVDSNWIVVDQMPDPGSPIGEGDAVLSVVKLEEPNPC